MIGDEVQVNACSITFSIGEDYTDTVWCNVVPMDGSDILLGHPWMYDKNGTNGMHDNIYTFTHSEKQVTLRPLKPAPPKKGSSSLITKEALQVQNIYKSNIKNRELLSDLGGMMQPHHNSTGDKLWATCGTHGI